MRPRQIPLDQRLSLLKVVLIYAVFASVWILLSDSTVLHVTGDPEAMTRISIIKGLGFVAVTSLLLYVLLRRTWRRNAAALNEQVELLRLQALVLDQIQDHVTVSDLDGVVTYVNATETRALKLLPGSRIGQHVAVYGEGPQADATQQEIVQATLAQGAWQGVVVNNREDGSAILLELRTTLVKDDDGQPVAMVGVGTDVTERRQAEAALRESEQHFRTLANSGAALIWTSGLDKLCNYFNEPWLRFTGRPLEEEIGNGWTAGVHPEDFDRCVHTYVTAFDQRQPFSMDYRLRHANGTYHWIRDDGNPRYDSRGEFIGYIGFCVDINQEKIPPPNWRGTDIIWKHWSRNAPPACPSPRKRQRRRTVPRVPSWPT